MITLTLRPLHLAIAAGFLAGILVAAGIVLLSGGDGSPSPDTASLDATVRPSPTTAPTSTPSPEPTAVPTEEPSPSPEPELTSTPVIRSCDEIRADPVYKSPEERQFFLDNCVDEPGPSGAVPTVASSGESPGETAEEATYRRKASAFMLGAAARFTQYFGQPSLGYVSDILELGSIAGSWANQMNGLEPVPPRFRQAHDQLRAALYDFSDWAMVITTVETLDQYYFWEDNYLAFWDELLLAWDDYVLVTGVDLPEPPR